MTIEKIEAIDKNVPYVTIFETELEDVFRIRIEFETLTPILVFPFEGLINLFDTIREYYQNNAAELIPKKLRPLLFEDTTSKYDGTLSEQLKSGVIVFGNNKGQQYFEISYDALEVGYVKGVNIDALVKKLLSYANKYHAQFLVPHYSLLKSFDSYCDKMLSIREFGCAFDFGSGYMVGIDNFTTVQEQIFSLVYELDFERVVRLRDVYIELHQKLGHEIVEMTVEDGWNEFLVYKAKRDF